MQVVDLMTTDVVTVSPDTPLREAAQLMVRHRVSGLPVVSNDDRLVGLVSEQDFVLLEVQHAEGRVASTVKEIMSGHVITVRPEETLSHAAHIMASSAVGRLPVVDGEGKIVGVVSRIDVVSAFTRPDELIEDEIREDVVRRVLFVNPDGVDVGVSSGVVTLSGEIGTRTEASLLGELVKRLDGVVGVINELTWRLDDMRDR